MTKTIVIAPVIKTLTVNAAQARAFEVFTAGLDRWWPKAHNLGTSAVLRSIIEPQVGGRWYTQHENGSEAVVGHMKIWEPPRRIVFSWEIGADWKCNPAVASEVEVTFVAEAANRTRVTLEHRGFEAMGAVDGAKMRGDLDNGWPGILELFGREFAA